MREVCESRLFIEEGEAWSIQTGRSHEAKREEGGGVVCESGSDLSLEEAPHPQENARVAFFPPEQGGGCISERARIEKDKTTGHPEACGVDSVSMHGSRALQKYTHTDTCRMYTCVGVQTSLLSV